MSVFHTHQRDTTGARSAVARLQASLMTLRAHHEAGEDFERFERAVHTLFVDAEREVLGEALERLDVDLPSVVIGGHVHHRVLRSAETYTSAVGPVTVLRTLYRRGTDRSVMPLELRAGMVEGHWTPLAARQAMWVVAHLTPGEGEGLFAELGNMRPSKSSLDRLPKRVSGRWEAGRKAFDASLRSHVAPPAQAVTVAVSLDGVMTPMKDGDRLRTRARQRADGKRTKGPAGYREVGCGTLSFYDADGERLTTVRLARMPESKKATLKSMLSAELSHVLDAHPDLTLVKLADGAKDNWTYLHDALPAGVELVDFYHAVTHLKTTFDAAYGEHTPKARSQFEKYRHVLLEGDNGVAHVIRAYVYLRDQHPRRTKIATELAYFRRHRHRMCYATVKARGLPIGSGVVEAACKTLVTQRLKRSGMRWRHPGGQAILTFRSLVQSDRFDHAWQLLSATYRGNVSPPKNVVPFPSKRVH